MIEFSQICDRVFFTVRRFLVLTADKNDANQLKKQRLQEEEEDDHGKNNNIFISVIT